MNRPVVLRAISLATLFLSSLPAAHAAGGTTGQSIMVNLYAPSAVTRQVNLIYRFDDVAAAGYFSNAYTGNYVCGPRGCPSPMPNPPAADARQLDATLRGNQCTFLSGGTLQGQSYEQTINGSGGTKATFYYAVTGAGSVAPLTAWVLFKETGDGGDGPVSFTLNADIAGLSALNKNGIKYSFSMGTNDASRVTGLNILVNDQWVFSPTSTIFMNTATAPVDFTYTGNAGSNGNTSLLPAAPVDARWLLNNDSFNGKPFPGNDNGGADGSALSIAKMQPVDLSFPSTDATYTIRLTGTVKDNAALADIPFSVSRTTRVIGQGCGGV